MITRDILRKAAIYNKNAPLFSTALIKNFDEFNIKSDFQQCFFLAQALHESGEFKWLTEKSNGVLYEMRGDLGNDKPGDGPRYIGRGIFQITGKFNYKRASDYFKKDFVNEPDLLATPDWAVKTACWFWSNNNLNRFVDVYNFLEITYRINGGYTHLKDRLKYLYKLFRLYKINQSEINIFTNQTLQHAELIYIKDTERRNKMLSKVVKRDDFKKYLEEAIELSKK